MSKAKEDFLAGVKVVQVLWGIAGMLILMVIVGAVVGVLTESPVLTYGAMFALPAFFIYAKITEWRSSREG